MDPCQQDDIICLSKMLRNTATKRMQQFWFWSAVRFGWSAQIHYVRNGRVRGPRLLSSSTGTDLEHLVMRKGHPIKQLLLKNTGWLPTCGHNRAVLMECLLGAAGVVHSGASLPLLQLLVCVLHSQWKHTDALTCLQHKSSNHCLQRKKDLTLESNTNCTNSLHQVQLLHSDFLSICMHAA